MHPQALNFSAGASHCVAILPEPPGSVQEGLAEGPPPCHLYMTFHPRGVSLGRKTLIVRIPSVLCKHAHLLQNGGKIMHSAVASTVSNLTAWLQPVLLSKCAISASNQDSANLHTAPDLSHTIA